MTNVRSISGIPQDLWDEAKQEYGNVSNGIKELLEKDLRQNQEQDQNHLDLLKKSDLTNKQIKVAKDLLTRGSKDKNGAQLGNVLRKYFTDDDYRDRCKRSIIESEYLPFERDGDGIRSSYVECENCESELYLAALRKFDFECLDCGVRVFDVE